MDAKVATPLDADGLLHAALQLSGELGVPGLCAKLGPLLASMRSHGACGVIIGRQPIGGLCVHDEERETLTTFFCAPKESLETAPPEDFEQDAHAADLALIADIPTATVIDLADAHAGLRARWRAAGLRRCLVIPVRLGERLLGALFLDVPAPELGDGPLAQSFAQLARLLAPVLWNCHTQARFSRGDRRRDLLVELSNAINTSLKLEAVLESARRAIRHLAGYCYSSISLLTEDGAHFTSYVDRFSALPRESALEPPRVCALVSGTALSAVLKTGQTYISDDLRDRRRGAEESALEQLGVRRFVATPMFVRNRVIGCFILGSTDPRRPLGIDIWLQENIALQLALAIDNARQLERVQELSERLAQQNSYLREEIQREHAFAGMVGASTAIEQVREAVARVAPTDATVLILGETGVGKELVARAICAASARAAQPMVKVNCAAIPDGMVESELFGHERGAFTTALERRIGRFELARDGTLFLDEVGELPLSLQAKLLRVLQDGQFERVGGTRTLTSNARIIAATNRQLRRAVEERVFRSDLFYRLNVFPIEVPPLRERREDIPLLANAFVQQYSRSMGRRVESIDPGDLACLCQRDWPGNVRELQHVVERTLILGDGPVLRIPDARGVAVTEASTNYIPANALGAATLANFEADHIRSVLRQTGGRIEGPRGAARILDLNPSTLRFRMKRHGIRRAD